ncbi:hypothetical protein FBUS_08566 [Fasciolopsis buskii]|uniref:Fibrous sheath-interacting protein 1 n=1 Tax=Fasciolopsis buskii TaxID=27845 RepID=A0A8E0VL71_9TREM|nr:hypothetical protein FBUS_08566 [Fasciolopsis buski]
MEEDNSVDLRVQEGLSRIEELDRILKAKVEREKQVKRQGRLLRKQIQMQLMEVTKTPDLMRAMHSGPRTPPPAMIDLTSAIKNYPNGLIRPRQDITLNIERPLALDSDSIHGPLDREANTLCFCAVRYDVNLSETCVSRLDDVNALADGDKAVGNLPENTESSSAYQSLEKSPCSHLGQNNCDYIRRNVELATKAGEILPQTASEEARLEELLADDDQHGLPFGFPIICSEAWSAESTTPEPGVVSAQGTQLDLQSGCQVCSNMYPSFLCQKCREIIVVHLSVILLTHSYYNP